MTQVLQQKKQHSLESQVRILGLTGLIPFVFFTLAVWFPALAIFDTEPLTIFRLYSVTILSFLAGALWPLGFLADLSTDKRPVRRGGLLWGSGIVCLAGWGSVMLEAKAGVFVSALLFLVIWQIEQKTLLAKNSPEWYTAFRAMLTMVVAICHIGIWLTLG